MNTNKPIVPKPIAPIGATLSQNGRPLFSQSRQSHHLKPGRPKVIVKPNIHVKNFRNIQPGLPIFVQGSPGPGVRAVIPSQIQMPRNVTTQEMGLI